jgi:hypothetical protein
MAQFNTPVSIIVSSLQVFPGTTTSPFVVIIGHEVHHDGTSCKLPCQVYVNVSMLKGPVRPNDTLDIAEYDLSDNSIHVRALV